MKIVLVLATFMYLVSWFTPVVDEGTTLGEGGVPGWEAFQHAMSPGECANPWYLDVLWVASALTNFWFLISLTILLLWPNRLNRVVLWGLVFCTLVNAHWFVGEGVWGCGFSDFRVGYYLWVGSFLVLTVGAGLGLKRRSGP